MNKEKKKTLDIIILIIYVIAYICFVAGLITNLFVMALISSMLIFLAGFYIVLSPLLSKERIKIINWIEIAVNFVLITAMIVMYVSVATDKIREAAIQITASILGGLITLYGVGLTIKYSRLDKLDDEIKRARPVVFPISSETLQTLKNIDVRYISFEQWKTDVLKPSEDEQAFYIFDIVLSISDLSMCVYHGIKINNHVFYFDFGQVLQRGSNVQLVHTLRFKLRAKENFRSISLLLEDMLGNIYETGLNFEINTQNLNQTIEIKSAGQTTLIENNTNK